MENDGLHAESIASCSAGVTWGYRRRSFVGELPRWGGGAVMDLSVAPAVAGSIGGSVFPAASAGMMAGAPAAAGTRGAASAPAVAGSIGGSVFPAASAGMMAGAPTAAGSRGAAPAVAGSIGGSVFPAASAGMMAGAPAAAGTRGAASVPAVVGGFGGNIFPAESVGMMADTPAVAGSSGATFQAVSSAVRPPPAIAFASDDHEDYQARRMLVGSCFCAVNLASFSTCVILFPTGLYLDRTADNYPAVENHRGGVVLVMRL